METSRKLHSRGKQKAAVTHGITIEQTSRRINTRAKYKNGREAQL